MSTLTAFTELPVVDVSGLRGSPEQVAATAAEIGRAARTAGFLYVMGHGIDSAAYDALLDAATRLAQPLDRKMTCYIGGSTCHRGYVPEGEEVFGGGTRDRKEAFDLGLDLPADHPAVLAGNPHRPASCGSSTTPTTPARGTSWGSARTPTTSASRCCAAPARGWRR